MNLFLDVFIFLITAICTRLFCVYAKKSSLIDVPNERSSHSIPTIRGGGVVFISLSLSSYLVLYLVDKQCPSDLLFLIMCSVFLALVSFIDDLYQLSAKFRLLVQAFITLLFLATIPIDTLDFTIVSISNPYLSKIVLFGLVLWAINHFNFMDGIDGLCALQAIFVLLAYGYLLIDYPAENYINFCSVVCVAVLGFLIFNFPPARLFMGDVGSATLGFIVFGVALLAQKDFQLSLVNYFILNAIFLFDATITLIRRFLNGEKLTKPHKSHAYQRVKQSGISNRKILLAQLVLNLFFFSVLVIFIQFKMNLFLLLSIQFILLFAVYYLIERKIPMF